METQQHTLQYFTGDAPVVTAKHVRGSDDQAHIHVMIHHTCLVLARETAADLLFQLSAALQDTDYCDQWRCARCEPDRTKAARAAGHADDDELAAAILGSPGYAEAAGVGD